MIGFYNYTVLLTYLGMLVSLVGLAFARSGHITNALLCLLFAGLCDMFDGKVAATKTRTDEERHFGIEIDSLSDLISFGILPAVIVVFMVWEDMRMLPIAAFYVLCALIRLAYFNVDEMGRQKETSAPRREYRGLPVTSIALILPLVSCLAGRACENRIWMLMPTMFITAIAFITPFKLKKPGNLGKTVMGIGGLALFLLLIGRVK